MNIRRNIPVITYVISIPITAFCILFLLTSDIWSGVSHTNSESYYQEQIARKVRGQREVVLDDGTRVDIGTATEVIEVEFAPKWYESIGQSAHYAVMTTKNPVVWLVVEKESDYKFVDRCRNVCENLQVRISKNHWVYIRVEVWVNK